MTRAATHPDRRLVLRGLAATLAVVPAAATGQGAAGDASGVASTPALAAEDAHRLTAAPLTRRLKPEPAGETELWAYDGAVPGPLLRAKRGAPFRLQLANGLPQATSLHWHGVHLANAMDGVAGLTQEALAPGASGELRFSPKAAGTFWYRPLIPAHAAEQTERGLYGLFVVEEDRAPAFDEDLALILDDWALDDAAQVRASFGEARETALTGRLGNWLTVNGKEPPETRRARPGGRLRLRILNAANARPFTLRFENLRVHVIAVDGEPAEPFAPARGSVSLVPGTRLDLAIEAPAETGGRGAVVAALGPGVPVLSIEADGSPSPLAGSPLAALPDNGLPAAIDLAGAARADLVIEGGLDPKASAPGAAVTLRDPARVWRLNGISWPDALKKPLVSVKAGRPVSLGLINRTPFLQAMHIHGHHVRLLHGLDDGWEPYWLDTIAIPAGQTARIAFLADNPGRWMIGSTILERLGTGLATWFEVT